MGRVPIHGQTRLHAGGAVIIILTRWHEDDLAARLLNPEYGKVEDWDIISLPAVCEDPATDPLGRELGEALWPAGGYDEAWAAQQKETVGTYAWSSLYMQTPTPSSGGMFKREWWKRWAALPSGLHDFIQSWDCTFKDKDGSDFVVGQVWARKGADRYLLDQVRGRMSFTETLDAMRGLSSKWPQTTRKLVEDKANGTAVIDVLKKEIPGIIPVEPFGGKDALKRLSCFFTASLPLHTLAYTENCSMWYPSFSKKFRNAVACRLSVFVCTGRSKKTIIRINLLIAMLLVFKQFG